VLLWMKFPPFIAGFSGIVKVKSAISGIDGMCTQSIDSDKVSEYYRGG
jgi:hypothetical protein